MKDKKRKYDLSYYMMHGGSDSEGYEPPPNPSNLNDELSEINKRREERERKETEREEQQLQGLLKESGVSPKEFGNFVIKTSINKAKASTSSTATGASIKPKESQNSRKLENKPAFESFAKSTLKGISKNERQVEKQKQKSNQRIAEIRAETEDKQRQRLEVITTILQEKGLTDNDVILIKDLYCSDQKKYTTFFTSFFEKKFFEYFSEIDKLKQNKSLMENINEKAIELVANNQKLSLETSKLISNLKKFGNIFKTGTEFDIASNGLFKQIHDDLNKLDIKSELNFKDLQKVLEYLFIVQEWIKVTYGQNLDIQIESKPTPDKLQKYLNTLLKISGEKNKELMDFNYNTFIVSVQKKVIKLLTKYAQDKLTALILDEQDTTKFEKIIHELIDLELFSKEKLDEIYKIMKNSKEKNNEEIEQANLTREQKVKLRFEKNEKNREVRSKIGTILSEPQQKISIMLGTLSEYFKKKPQAGGINKNFVLPKQQQKQRRRQFKKKIKKQDSHDSLSNKGNKPVVLAKKENATANSTAKTKANSTTKENWETVLPLNIPTETKQISWRNRVVSAEKSRKEKEKNKKAEKELKEKLFKDAEIKLSKNRIQRFLNNKGNEKYRDLVVNPKKSRAWRQELSFPNRLNSSNRQFMNINNSQILRRNNNLKEPDNEQKFSTILKIIEQIKAKKLKKEKKIVELVKRLNKVKTQTKINKITERINRLAGELKNQEEDNNNDENINNENNLVLMISPTQRISDLSVTIRGKKIILKNIIDVYKDINNLYGQIFLIEAYKDRINELKNEIFEEITSNGSFTFENTISALILDLLNEHGYPNLFIDQLLGLNNVDKLIGELIEILKDNLCKILEKEDYLPDKHYKELFEKAKHKVVTVVSRELPKLIDAFQSNQVSNQTVADIPFFQQLLRIQNSSAQRNSNSNNSSAQRSSPVLNNSSSQRNSNSNNSSAQQNSNFNNSSAKSRALTVTTRTLFNPNPVLLGISANQKAKLKAEIKNEQNKINKEKENNKKKDLGEVIKEIKNSIRDIKLEGINIPTEIEKSIRKRIQRLPDEGNAKTLRELLEKKLKKLKKEIDEKKAAAAAAKNAAAAAAEAAAAAAAAEAAAKAAAKAAKKAPTKAPTKAAKKAPTIDKGGLEFNE